MSDGFDYLGVEDVTADKTQSSGASWYSQNKAVVWTAGIIAAAVTGFALYDHFAPGYVPGRTPRGWKQGVGWKSEAHRIRADKAYEVWRDRRNAQLQKELAPYREAAARRMKQFEARTAPHRRRSKRK
jgi:hypothetical protein